MSPSSPDRVLLGRISGVYGVKGWVRVYSYTDPRANILNFSPWYIIRGRETRQLALAEGRIHGKGVIARVAGCEDRDSAADLQGARIEVDSAQLESLPQGEYYWTQLIGLSVVDTQGRRLGVVDEMMETGANDVLVLDSGELIPWLRNEVVKSIDLERRVLEVDWDVNY